MVTMTPLKRARLADARQPSQLDVAKALKISQPFYAMLESGERAASAVVAQALADFFRVEVGTIFSPTRYSSEPVAAEV